MSVSDGLQKYLEAQFGGLPTDDLRKALVKDAEEQFEAIRKDRQIHDAKWYQNQRFMDGDHYLTWDKQTGKTYNQELAEDGKNRRIKRSINIMKAQIRGLKNFVLKVPLTVEVSAIHMDDQPEAVKAAEQDARQKNNVVRAIEHKLKLRELRRPIVDDGFLKNAAYVVVLPTPDGFVDVKHYDSYDVFPDPTAPSFYDGKLLYLATRQNVGEIKANKAYENTDELKGDGRLAASTFKNNYEQSRSAATRMVMQGDLETVIWKQMFLKFPFTIQPVTQQVERPVLDPNGQPVIDPATAHPQMEVTDQPVIGADGQPQQQLVPTEDGKPRIWIITFTSTELHRCEETDFTRWPAIRYCPEQTGNRVHGNAWATDLQDPNRIVDNMISKAEEWHIKSSPKLLVPSDSKLKEVTSVTAEVLEYNPRTADGIKDYMPSGVPTSMQWLINTAQNMASDMGGMHPASGGTVPIGVKSGRGIEALQAGDAELNMAEPMENFGLMWQEMWERILEVVSQNTVDQMTLPFQDNGATKQVTFMGKNGLKQKNGTVLPAPANTVIIGDDHVSVRTVPEVSYSEDGRREILKELFGMQAIDLQTLLEGYKFSSVQDIIGRVMAEQWKKANMPPPPPPVPADKLMHSLALLRRAGEPITLDQLNKVMSDAGLPPSTPSLEAPIPLPPDGVTPPPMPMSG